MDSHCLEDMVSMLLKVALLLSCSAFYHISPLAHTSHSFCFLSWAVAEFLQQGQTPARSNAAAKLCRKHSVVLYIAFSCFLRGVAIIKLDVMVIVAIKLLPGLADLILQTQGWSKKKKRKKEKRGYANYQGR